MLSGCDWLCSFPISGGFFWWISFSEVLSGHWCISAGMYSWGNMVYIDSTWRKRWNIDNICSPHYFSVFSASHSSVMELEKLNSDTTFIYSTSVEQATLLEKGKQLLTLACRRAWPAKYQRLSWRGPAPLLTTLSLCCQGPQILTTANLKEYLKTTKEKRKMKK